MATDYDAPRKSDIEIEADNEADLAVIGGGKPGEGKVDEDENEVADDFELPGADLSGESLTVRVVPRQNDEFVCSQCFLVGHRSQIAATDARGQQICGDCA